MNATAVDPQTRAVRDSGLVDAAQALEAFIVDIGRGVTMDRRTARLLEHRLREIEAYLRSARAAIQGAERSDPV